MDFSKLEKLLEEYRYKENLKTEKAFHERIALSIPGFDKMKERRDLKVSTLEMFCKLLKVSPCIFFDDYKQSELNPSNVSEPENEYKPNKCKELNDKLQRLENELRLKDELIRTYHQLISNKDK